MSEPNFALMDAINTYLPYIGMVVVGIVAAVVFVWYTRKYTPEIARRFIKAYHSRALPLFLQDEMGNVDLHICDKKFPEGVIHVKDKGWFLLPSPPTDKSPDDEPEDTGKKRGPGRPPKESYKSADEVFKMSDKEKEDYAKAYGTLVQTPILRGFGKQVFFGSTVSAAVSNLAAIATVSNMPAIAQADLLAVRKLAPKMYQKTQLDALATGSRIEGLKMGNKEVTKLLMYAIIAAVVICAIFGGVYLLTQRPTAALELLTLA